LKEILLEIALKKASSIQEALGRAGLEDMLEEARRLWIEHKPRRDKPRTYGAVDGSSKSIEFKGLTFYAVIGYAVARSSDGVNEYLVGDVDVTYDANATEHVRMLREIAEIKAACLMPELDMLMVDGSLTSLLIRPRPLADETVLSQAHAELKRATHDGIVEELMDMLRGQLSSRARSRLDAPYVSRLLGTEYKLYAEGRRTLSVLLEYFEKLLSIRLLLERKVLSTWPPRLAFISKTSHSKHYFVERELMTKRVLPSDILLFSYATVRTGYSPPYPESEREFKHLPRSEELEWLIGRFFDNIEYITSYVRLEEGGPVLKVEIPVDKNTVKPDKYSLVIERTVDALSSLAYRGYPYPLIEVDKLARITRQDIVNLAQIVGILPRMTGREVLVEWL
jgi:hypothetical protein